MEELCLVVANKEWLTSWLQGRLIVSVYSRNYTERDGRPTLIDLTGWWRGDWVGGGDEVTGSLVAAACSVSRSQCIDGLSHSLSFYSCDAIQTDS